MPEVQQPPPDEPLEYNVPEGYELRWVPEGPDWRLVDEEEHAVRICRRPGCKRSPVAALKRRNSGWWLYCDWHLYGRKIEDGVLLVRVVRKLEPA